MTEQPLTPVEQHHYDTITDRIGMNRLAAEERAAKGAEAPEPRPAQPTAPDPAYLAAVLRHRQAMQAQLDRAKAIFAEVDTDATALLAQQYTATKSTKADVTLPDGETKIATVTRVGGETEAQVTDRDAFHAWVRDTYPDHFGFRIVPARTEVTVDDAFTDQVLASVTAANSAEYADPETGVVHEVPGVTIKATRRPYFRWLFTRASKRQPLDGRDLAAQAVAAGLISTDTPPALPAAEPPPAAAEPDDQ
ncbi:hypothetical protein OG909_12085 [Streptomyces sp. NBC_01754]|uniref:hypothetical protein n=1 Tax=Streptomyces sp. NBC_01754 TaxID=2975930 RepID=UPI002DDBD83C|nr:hypothetical protein [Streptomyces sp. NBC_01754]WSC92973.1 hypothetical protein OG909_12085 [Streptomyces sp. NBC_01754]